MTDRIELRVDELVLEGFRASDRVAVGEALERELARLIAHDPPGGLGSARSTEHVDAGTAAVHAGTPPDEAGARIARTVHRGLGR